MNKSLIAYFLLWYLLTASTTFAFTHADTLRGSNGEGRSWWDVMHYDLTVDFNLENKTISGNNEIRLKILSPPHDSLQLDLQEPMTLDSVLFEHLMLPLAREGNAWWIIYPFHNWRKGDVKTLTAWYHGTPTVAVNPPWNGGFIYKNDSTGKPWVAVACQGAGASLWWPCKDIQSDEPDSGVDMHYTIPDDLACIGNGRLIDHKKAGAGRSEWHWKVINPINNYDVTFYIGDYIHWNDTLTGEKGPLTLDYYALRENEGKAHKQFEVVKPMLHCFESWLGPYPFYEDGYKLIEAPYLGMEHQSAVAYGNKYQMGYLGNDRSGSGTGMLFDYIIIHESGHEWFGNNITAADIADNWIHEGLTTYTESLFVTCAFGKQAADQFCEGEWKNIRNDRPVIGDYGVNNEGSNDMYDKGAAIMHMLHALSGDTKFRNMLRSLNTKYYHQVVTTQQVEHTISSLLGMNLAPFFNQYLRTATIPEVEYYVQKKRLHYRFKNVEDGFSLPVSIQHRAKSKILNISAAWHDTSWKGGYNVTFDRDFLIKY